MIILSVVVDSGNRTENVIILSVVVDMVILSVVVDIVGTEQRT